MLPPVEASWCSWLAASTEVTYPPAPGAVRLTLLSLSPLSRTLYEGSILVELWAARATSDTDAAALHSRVLAIDSAPGAAAYFTGVTADGPVPHPDPDSDLDRYQFISTFAVRAK